MNISKDNSQLMDINKNNLRISFTFYDDKFCSALNELEKMINLLRKNEIDDKLIDVWIEKNMEEWSKKSIVDENNNAS